MTNTGNDLSRGVDVQSLHWELLFMVTHHAQKPVRVEMDSPDVTVFTARHHHVVGDGDDTVDSVRMTRELVAVQSVLVLTGKIMISVRSVVSGNIKTLQSDEPRDYWR